MITIVVYRHMGVIAIPQPDHTSLMALMNYSPVANLSFMSKIIEKAIATQIHDNVKNNDIVDNFQSAH